MAEQNKNAQEQDLNKLLNRLGGWSPHIPTGFHVSGGTLDTDGCSGFSCTGLSPSSVGLPIPFH